MMEAAPGQQQLEHQHQPQLRQTAFQVIFLEGIEMTRTINEIKN